MKHPSSVSRRAVRALAVAMAVVILAAMPIVGAADSARHGAGEPVWARHLRAADAAIARGDSAAALRALQQAHVAALSARRWEGLVAVGDAALRVGEATGDRTGALTRARQAYLTALFRARAAGSLDGALRAAEAFAAIGDAAVAERALRVAQALALSQGDPAGLDRVSALAERLGEHSLAAGALRVEPF